MDKAVILAGGKGLRLGHTPEDLPKPMMLVQGRPILFYVISLLKTLNFKKLYIIVGYKKEKVIEHFGSGSALGLNIEYIDNSNINHAKKSGLSDAVLLVKDIIKEPFMTILGDEIYSKTRHSQMLADFESNKGYESSIAVHETENIEEVKKNYSVKLDSSGNILDLEEKPQNPWNNLIGCGTYIFSPAIFEYIAKTPYSQRSGRRELADSMKLIIKDNRKIHAFDIGGRYLNINYPQDMATAEKIMGEK